MSFKYDSLDRYVRSYGENILRQARQRLEEKDVTGNLSKSLDFDIKKKGNKWTLEFSGVKYADFVNKGVRGTEKSRTYIDIEGKRKRSPYSFKKGKENAPPPTKLRSWAKARGLKGRYPKDSAGGKGGQYMSDKSFGFALSRGIQKAGTPAASFYTQPISWSFNLFKKNVEKHIKIDIENYIKQIKFD